VSSSEDAAALRDNPRPIGRKKAAMRSRLHAPLSGFAQYLET